MDDGDGALANAISDESGWYFWCTELNEAIKTRSVVCSCHFPFQTVEIRSDRGAGGCGEFCGEGTPVVRMGRGWSAPVRRLGTVPEVRRGGGEMGRHASPVHRGTEVHWGTVAPTHTKAPRRQGTMAHRGRREGRREGARG